MSRLILLTVLYAAATVHASPPQRHTASQLSLSSSRQLAAAAEDACAARGKSIAVALVDTGGQTVLLARGDGVGPHNSEAARRKAYTALSTKTATLQLARNARSNPDTANLAQLPELLLLGGGIPLWQGETLVGAIGVAGGGGPEGDDLCARAALTALPDFRTY